MRPVSGLTRLQALLAVAVSSTGSAGEHLAQPGVDLSQDHSIGTAQPCGLEA